MANGRVCPGNKHFLCSLFPNSVFVPLFPSKCGIWSTETNAIFPVPQNPCEGLNYGQWLLIFFLLNFDFHTTYLNLLGQKNIVELMLMSSFERRTRILSKQCRPWWNTAHTTFHWDLHCLPTYPFSGFCLKRVEYLIKLPAKNEIRPLNVMNVSI